MNFLKKVFKISMLLYTNTLLSMVEKVLLGRDKKEVCGAILADFSKDFTYSYKFNLIACQCI